MSIPGSRTRSPVLNSHSEQLPHSSGLPLVTVGIPVFNAESRIGDCIQQVLSQSYKRLEILISDNASTDGTSAILAKLETANPRLKVFYQTENLGSIRNFDLLMKQAAGEYFIWLAHDDEWSPDLVEKCVRVMRAHPDVVLCQPRTIVVPRSAPHHVMHINRLRGFESSVSPLSRALRVGRMLPATAIYGLFRTEALRRSGGMRVEPGGDLAFFPRLLSGGSALEVPEAEYRYTFAEEWRASSDEIPMIMGRTESNRQDHNLLSARFRRLMRTRREWFPQSGWIGAVAEGSALFHYMFERVTFKLARALPPNLRYRFAGGIYWRFIHNPNSEVIDQRRYESRVVRAKV